MKETIAYAVGMGGGAELATSMQLKASCLLNVWEGTDFITKQTVQLDWFNPSHKHATSLKMLLQEPGHSWLGQVIVEKLWPARDHLYSSLIG